MLAKAKTLDGKIVEGYYIDGFGIGLGEIIKGIYVTSELIPYCYEIDPQTLEYKIGDEWYSMETLEHITEDLDIEYLPKGNYER